MRPWLVLDQIIPKETPIYTIEEATADTLNNEYGDIFAFAVGFLYQKALLTDQYPELDDVPEPLRSFLEGVFDTADELEQRLTLA